ncbi:unnamed protein product [Symbiodinium sp. CCMP2592]|nr:unnamed protein product [Symbiodinium sp. CCMP2592]
MLVWGRSCSRLGRLWRPGSSFAAPPRFHASGPSDIERAARKATRKLQVDMNRQLRQARGQEFLDMASKKADEMDFTNVVVCLGRLAKMDEGHPTLSAKLLTLCSVAGKDFVPAATSWHSLTNLAWAACRLADALPELQSTTEALLESIFHRAATLGIATASGRDLPVLVWALAWTHRSGRSASALPLEDLASAVTLHLTELQPQGLAMLLWGFAVFEATPRQELSIPRSLYKAVLSQVETEVSQLKARELSNIVWSVATVQVPAPEWLTAPLPSRAKEFLPQESANVLWALAVSSLPATLEDFVIALQAGGRCTPEEFAAWKPQELAAGSWALAMTWQRQKGAGVPQEVALSALRRAATGKVTALEGKELAMLSSALLLQEDEELSKRIAEHAEALHKSGSLPPDAIVQIRDHLHSLSPPWLEVAMRRLTDEVLAALKTGSDLSVLHLTSLGAATLTLLLELGLGAESGAESSEEVVTGRSAGQVLCSVSYDIRIPGGHDVYEPGQVHVSGSRPDPDGLGLLRAVSLRFPRDRDAEYLALLLGLPSLLRYGVLRLPLHPKLKVERFYAGDLETCEHNENYQRWIVDGVTLHFRQAGVRPTYECSLERSTWFQMETNFRLVCRGNAALLLPGLAEVVFWATRLLNGFAFGWRLRRLWRLSFLADRLPGTVMVD